MGIDDRILGQHIAVLGKTGSGKTSTGKLIVEHVADGARVCVLDPIKSDWWGLTSSADGRHPGLPFQILGGPRGHVALHSSAGAAIAEVVATNALPLSIIDMADFEPGGQSRFFVEFAPTLLRKMRGVLYLVMEEAHLFAPKERSGIGAENMSIHWAKMLATAGRSKGVRLIILTQRTQALHNALLGSCDTMIAHRLTAPADQKPVLDWLKANVEPEIARKVASSLSSLKTGEAWVCSGEARIFERTHFDRIRTYDNSRTPTDSDAAHDVATAQVDTEALRKIIGTAVQDAEANDPKKLRARIAELEAELRGREEMPREKLAEYLAGEFRRGRSAGLSSATRTWRDYVSGSLSVLVDRLQPHIRDALINGTRTWMAEIESGLATEEYDVGWRDAAPDASPAEPEAKTQIRALERDQRVTPNFPEKSESSSLPKGEAAVLTAIAQHRHGVTREQITILAGYKRSTRDAYIQRLRERDAIAVDGDRIRATQAGIGMLGDFEPLPTGAALREYWLRRLPEGERSTLAALIESYPRDVDRDTVSARTGYKRSTRDAYLQRLMARQLIAKTAGGVIAKRELFE